VQVWLDKQLAVGWQVFKKDPPVLSAALVVKAAYRLAPGQMEFVSEDDFTVTGDLYREEDPAKSLHYASDLALFKPRADVLLVGAARAPGGFPVHSLAVRLRVGDLCKTIEVIGNRKWEKRFFGARTSTPEPFVTMPLGYENAFGGAGYRYNPVGKGKGGADLPNLEDPRHRIGGPWDTPEPAGFGPLAADWGQRAGRLGTYDKKWFKTRWPWLPEDFDWGHFNAAPRDQQVEGYLRGDEVLELDNLHPSVPELRSRLPGRRARWFLLERLAEGGTSFREVPLHLDTLWIDVDSEKLVLVWRGLTNARSMGLKEIDQMLVITEPLEEPVKPLAFYQEELERRRTADDREFAALEEEANRQLAEAEAKLPPFDAEAEAQAAQAQAQANPSAPAPALDLAEVCAYLRETLANLEQQGASPEDPRVREVQAKLAQVKQLQTELADETPETRESVQARAVPGASFAEKNLSGLDLSGLDLSGVDFTEANLGQANLSGARLAGANLKGALMAGADLTGADLEGAVLDDAYLGEARLAKARMMGVSLNGTVLSGVDFEGMDFSGCQGKQTDFSGAKLARARFQGTRFPGADFSECHLEGADFSGAELPHATFDSVVASQINMAEADLSGFESNLASDFTGACFRGVKGAGSVWQEARLDGADFTGALLDRAIFAEASLQRVCCDGAMLASANFADSILCEAVLTGCNLLRASFDRADLTQADLRGSNLFEAGFWEAITEKTNFRGANLKSTLLG
jgi:uncharacterized protein YjbI with pentapeptide repeats